VTRYFASRVKWLGTRFRFLAVNDFNGVCAHMQLDATLKAMRMIGSLPFLSAASWKDTTSTCPNYSRDSPTWTFADL
jgi:hypothetical protein